MSALRHLPSELEALRAQDRLRVRPDPRENSSGRINLCSNDYLGYASTRRLDEIAARAVGGHWSGAAASRLVCGEHHAHRALEAAIGDWLGTASALVFTSGYAANVGVIAALAGEGDLIVSDALNHASLIDGCRLSGARVSIVAHCSAEAVREALRQGGFRRRWVVTESHFSMDGDEPPLRDLRAICNEQDAALVVDEAHALGIWGPEGRGLCAARGVEPDVLIGTLGKAIGAQGAFVAGSESLCDWLWNRARTFVFSTGLSPLLAEIARGAIGLLRQDEVGRRHLEANTRRLSSGMAGAGISMTSRGPSGLSMLSPILPVILGTEGSALRFARQLADRGIDVQAIRPPTVPKGTSRLRVTSNAALTFDEIERAIAAFSDVAAAHGISRR